SDLLAGRPGHPRSYDEEQAGEEPLEDPFGERGRECDSRGHAAGRSEADDERRPPAYVAVAVLLPGAHEDDGDDRRQRGGLRGQLREPHDERERGHEEDAAANAEHSGENAGGEAEDDGVDHRHPMKSLSATAKSSTLRSNVSNRV